MAALPEGPAAGSGVVNTKLHGQLPEGPATPAADDANLTFLLFQPPLFFEVALLPAWSTRSFKFGFDWLGDNALSLKILWMAASLSDFLGMGVYFTSTPDNQSMAVRFLTLVP